MTKFEEECRHTRAKHGPGSAYCWMQCADCGEPLGMDVPVAVLLARIEDAQKSLVEAHKWAEWKASHPDAQEPL